MTARKEKGAHSVDPAELAFFADLQTILRASRVVLPTIISRICAVDAAYDGSSVTAVASLFEHGQVVERASCTGSCTFPYVSGLFYLREGPFVTEAVRRLTIRPQLVCFDAQGAAHPRGAGLATVCGMVLGIPSIGMAKSRLVGTLILDGSEELKGIIYGKKNVGFLTTADGAKTYWSTGFSVKLSELEFIIQKHGASCKTAMADSDRAAREQLQRL